MQVPPGGKLDCQVGVEKDAANLQCKSRFDRCRAKLTIMLQAKLRLSSRRCRKTCKSTFTILCYHLIKKTVIQTLHVAPYDTYIFIYHIPIFAASSNRTMHTKPISSGVIF